VTESPEQPPQPEQPQSPAEPPPAPPAASTDITTGASGGDFPVRFEVDYPGEYNRWLPLVKWLLAIPHWIALFFVAIGAFFAIIGAFFAVLFTAKYPQGIFNFLVGFWRWAMRVSVYAFLQIDAYPPFSLADDPNYPVRFDVEYPPEGKIARWRALFAWVPVIPQLIIATILVWIAYIATVISFFAILFTKSNPRGVFDFIVKALQFQNRANAYAYFMTEKYPGFDL
jgi:hypothetical protein